MYAFATSAALSPVRGAQLSSSAFVSRAVAARAPRTAVPRRAPHIVASLPDVAATAFPLVPLAADMHVTFPAYLAVFLGTLIPVAFLIILFIQSEARKSGEQSGRSE
jgi:photosystem II reaction center protein PsbM